MWLAHPARVRGQTSLGAPLSATGMGPLSMSPGQLMGTGGSSPPPSDAISVTDSFVSFNDSAVPRNVFILRFDAGYNMTEPSRAEYFLAKGGLPNSPGLPQIETRINSFQELSSYAEYALVPWFSVFVNAPYVWLNPDVNGNAHGAGDMQYGLKLCTWTSGGFIATIQLKLYQDSASPYLGTDHWSFEPGLLAAYQITDKFLLEGQVRYWIPLGGTDFAGDVLEYGLGLSYGKRQAGFWFTPVAECVGWTCLGGKTMLASSPTNYVIEDARNQTIVNGYLGIRLGYGSFDVFAGYGRCFTGDAWARDNVRLEVRFIY